MTLARSTSLAETSDALSEISTAVWRSQFAHIAAVLDVRMDAYMGPKLRHVRYGNAGRSVIFTTKTLIYPSFSTWIGFRSEHCGSGRDWIWTFSLLLDWISESRRHPFCFLFAPSEHITTRSRLRSGPCQTHLFVTFATIPTPSLMRWDGVLLYLSLVDSWEELAVYDRGWLQWAECVLLIPYFYTCFCLGLLQDR
jgi:hypothetical protein